MRLRTVAALLATTATALTLTACGQESDAAKNAVAVGGTFQFHSPGGQTEIFYDESERAPLPDIAGDSLMEEGEQISLSDFEGEVVILNAWGQWCAPCRSESDDLQAVHEKMQADGLGTMLGINVRDHVISAPRDFVEDNGLTYPSIYDPPFRSAAHLGGVPSSVIPTTIILDREHRPAAVFLKEVTDQELLDVALPLITGSGEDAA